MVTVNSVTIFYFRAMKYLIPAIMLMLIACQPSADKEIAAIETVLTEQAGKWNEGDIEGYMTGYWNNDSLLFIGRGGPGYGYKNTLERYKKGYPDRATMGHLTFSELHYNRLSSEYYHVTGKYELTREKGDASGYFTLIFRKINGNWRIVADHSS